MIADFVEDLSPYTVAEIEQAIAAYRRDPESKFFPKPGELCGIIDGWRKERRANDRISNRPLAESRPLMWWYKPRSMWKANWREGDIPGHEREAYEVWKRAKGAAA